MSISIRPFQQTDFKSVCRIYQEGIDTGHATFQTQAKNWQEWQSSTLEQTRIVAVLNDVIVGWAALSPTSSRLVYAGVTEISIYVSASHRTVNTSENLPEHKGIGTKLMSALISLSEKQNIWTIQAGIFPENKASITLHKKFGFKVVGVREKIGKMNGVWRDSILMERRSKLID